MGLLCLARLQNQPRVFGVITLVPKWYVDTGWGRCVLDHCMMGLWIHMGSFSSKSFQFFKIVVCVLFMENVSWGERRWVYDKSCWRPHGFYFPSPRWCSASSMLDQQLFIQRDLNSFFFFFLFYKPNQDN